MQTVDSSGSQVSDHTWMLNANQYEGSDESSETEGFVHNIDYFDFHLVGASLGDTGQLSVFEHTLTGNVTSHSYKSLPGNHEYYSSSYWEPYPYGSQGEWIIDISRTVDSLDTIRLFYNGSDAHASRHAETIGFFGFWEAHYVPVRWKRVRERERDVSCIPYVQLSFHTLGTD
jgi:hypothetical protein